MNYLKIITFACLVTLLSSSVIACKKKKENTAPAATTTIGNNASNPTSTTGASVANITVTTGSVTTTLMGPCGWAVAAGVNYIGANDQVLNQRIFTINFNIANLPSQTTTYFIVASSTNSLSVPSIVDVHFTQISGSNLLSWDSSNNSGYVTLTVSGDKITVNLVGIKLTAQTNSGFFTNLNVGELAKPGIMTGTLVFYK